MEQEKGQSTEPISMENWEDALEESLAGSAPYRGELREGTILSKTTDGGLVVDIGAKRDGLVPSEDLEELTDAEFEVGQTVRVIVKKSRDDDGNVDLSISQALLQEDWIKAEELKDKEETYETTVLGSNRGGLTVEFGRLRGFIPMSQLIGFSRIRHPAERYRRLEAKVGKSILLKVIEVNRRRRRLIMSELAAIKEWRAARRAALLEELDEGQVRRGRISQITNFGLFVNLGGLDGLVHVSELSWGRIDDPGEVYRPGQRIKVKVLNVDRDRQRIALSIKALKPDPWETVPERYEAGQLVEGKVTQMVDFGIFIELEPGVEGLLHNSELGSLEQREELESGKKILIKIIRVEQDRRRIGLSVRQVRREEWEIWAAEQLELAAKEQEVEEVEEVDEVDEADLDEDSDLDDIEEDEEEEELDSDEEVEENDVKAASEVENEEVEAEAETVAAEAQSEVEAEAEAETDAKAEES